MLKVKDEEKILKAVSYLQGAPIRLSADFSNFAVYKGMARNTQSDEKQGPKPKILFQQSYYLESKDL